MMRRLLFALVLLAAPVLGAEPKALLSGPETALTRTIVRLDPSGSVSDKKLLVRLWKGPERVTPEPLYNKAGGLVCYEVVPTRAGSYEFVAVAIGDAPAPADPLFDFAFWTVVVGGGPGPSPAPYVPPPVVVPPPPVTPPPPPPPTPIPQPNPTPQVVRVPLFAILAYDLDPTEPGHVAMAGTLNDPALGPALAQIGITWYVWPFNTAMIDSLNLRPYIGTAGAPVLLIYDAQGKVYDANGNEVNRVGAAFRPPATSEGIVSLFRKLKGQ